MRRAELVGPAQFGTHEAVLAAIGPLETREPRELLPSFGESLGAHALLAPRNVSLAAPARTRQLTEHGDVVEPVLLDDIPLK